jgi:hypothetical protein
MVQMGLALLSRHSDLAFLAAFYDTTCMDGGKLSTPLFSETNLKLGNNDLGSFLRPGGA